MKILLCLLATASLATVFVSCERHSWEGETRHLFQEHGAGAHGDGSKDAKGHEHGDKGHSDKDHE